MPDFMVSKQRKKGKGGCSQAQRKAALAAQPNTEDREVY